jgi:hypothetical protein
MPGLAAFYIAFLDSRPEKSEGFPGLSPRNFFEISEGFRGNDRGKSRVKFLIYGDDFFDLRDFFLQESFDAHFEGHTRAWAAGAGALKANLDGLAVFSANKLDVAAVTLQVWSDSVYYRLNLLFEGILGFLITTAALFAHRKSPIVIKGILSLYQLFSLVNTCFYTNYDALLLQYAGKFAEKD